MDPAKNGNTAKSLLENPADFQRISERGDDSNNGTVSNLNSPLNTSNSNVHRQDGTSNISAQQSDLVEGQQVQISNSILNLGEHGLGLLDMNGSEAGQLQVVANANLTSVSEDGNSIYLLVTSPYENKSNESSSNQNKTIHHQQALNMVTTLKDVNLQPGTTVQIINSDGLPVSVGVSDILSSLTPAKSMNSDNHGEKSSKLTSSQSPINLPGTSSESASIKTFGNEAPSDDVFTFPSTSAIERLSSLGVPNWACHLRDCTLCGDTYTGYVLNDAEMDTILNMYKKETQSLFAIRQTPSPAKDERADTVRLMWKSQYVPYDGIPFVNIGKLCTVDVILICKT